MRVIVVGLGVQGIKRRATADKEIVATVDPVHSEANYKSLADVPLDAGLELWAVRPQPHGGLGSNATGRCRNGAANRQECNLWHLRHGILLIQCRRTRTAEPPRHNNAHPAGLADQTRFQSPMGRICGAGERGHASLSAAHIYPTITWKSRDW